MTFKPQQAGFSNKPRILRGAFVEYGISATPLFVAFQFNPEQVTRSRNLTFSMPGETKGQEFDLRQEHRKDEDKFKDLIKFRDAQKVIVHEESFSFEIRLDATDKLNEGDLLAEQFGISPQLAVLELMTLPKGETLLGKGLAQIIQKLGGPSGTFSFTGNPNPPLVLFVWGRKRVLPVNINSMTITETMYSADLNPLRASVNVNLTVIESSNKPYQYSRAQLEAMAVLNLANITEVANVVIPG